MKAKQINGGKIMLSEKKKIVLMKDNRIVGEVIILVEKDTEIKIISDKN